MLLEATADELAAEHRRYLWALAQQQRLKMRTPPRPSRVEAAREALRARASLRYPETDLINASRRACRRHAEQQALERARHELWCADLEAIAALPDDDLAWLLSMGWQPDAYPWGVS